MRWSRYKGSTLVKHFPILQVQSKDLTWEDISSIWSSISSLIERHLDKKAGIRLPNLGTFGYVTKRMDLGMNILQTDQYPVFILEDKLALTYGLKRLNVYIEDEVPIKQLNLAVLANLLSCDDPRLKHCYISVMKKVKDHLTYNKPFELPFPGVGKLKYSRFNYKFIFNADFMNTHRIIETQPIRSMEPPSDQHHLHVIGCTCDVQNLNIKGNETKSDKAIKNSDKITRSIKQVKSINKELKQEQCGDVVEEIMKENIYNDSIENPLISQPAGLKPCKNHLDKVQPCPLPLKQPCIINCDEDSLKAMLQEAPFDGHETFNFARMGGGGGENINDLNQLDNGKGDENEKKINNFIKSQNLSESENCLEVEDNSSSLQCECSSENEDPYSIIHCHCEECLDPSFASPCEENYERYYQPLKKSRSTSSMIQEKSSVPKRPHTSKYAATSRDIKTPKCYHEKFTFSEDCVQRRPPVDKSCLPLALRMETDVDDPEWFCEECRERAYLDFVRRSRCRLKDKQIMDEVAQYEFLKLQQEEEALNNMMKANRKRENLRKDSLHNRDYGEFLKHEAKLLRQMANDHNNQYVFRNRPATPPKDKGNKAFGKELEHQIKCRERQLMMEKEKQNTEDVAQRDYFMNKYADEVDKERQQKRQEQREMMNALTLQQIRPRHLPETGSAFVMPYEQREKYLAWVKNREIAERKENWNTYLKRKEEIENQQCDELEAEARMLAKLQDEAGKETGWKYWKKQAKLNEAIQNLSQAMKEKHDRELYDKYYWECHAPSTFKTSNKRQCHNCCRTFDLAKKEHATWRMEERWPYREVHYALAS